jgi:hypothetical protein
MMLELILTRYEEMDRRVVEHCAGWSSWCWTSCTPIAAARGGRGLAGAAPARAPASRAMVCIGTSATMSSTGSQADRNQTVSDVASKLFGTRITEHDVIGETLERVTDPTQGRDSHQAAAPRGH